ncbi:S-(hydroxymethyl)glutathione dehydrogenase [Sarracenia purpurea var. burkii]
MILAALVMEAGLPDGVLNVVHGTNEIANHICDDDDVKAISFVGSNTVILTLYHSKKLNVWRVTGSMIVGQILMLLSDIVFLLTSSE